VPSFSQEHTLWVLNSRFSPKNVDATAPGCNRRSKQHPMFASVAAWYGIHIRRRSSPLSFSDAHTQ
jgi:hypothetical protein